MTRLRRALAWLLVRAAVVLIFPGLVALLAIALVMLLFEDPVGVVLLVVDSAAARKLRSWAHTAWAGWTP